MLDVIAALLSGGRATFQVPVDPEQETGLSQMFIAFSASSLGGPNGGHGIADAIIANLHEGNGNVRYPGERTLQTRRSSLEQGVPVDPSVWRVVQDL